MGEHSGKTQRFAQGQIPSDTNLRQYIVGDCVGCGALLEVMVSPNSIKQWKDDGRSLKIVAPYLSKEEIAKITTGACKGCRE